MPNPSLKAKLDAIFNAHMNAELAGDLDQTLATMAPNPHLVNVPTMVGGQGPQGVRTFYSKRLIGQFFPPDVTIETISRTYSEERLIDELIISFTHTIKMDHCSLELSRPESGSKQCLSLSLASKATRSPTSTSCGTRRVFLSSLASSIQRVFQSSARAPPRS